MEDERTCVGCTTPAGKAYLEKCRMCFKYFCADCAHSTRGAKFCSESCGGLFLWGDGEDLEGYDDA